ncbi:glycosyltransferase family 4 protein [Pseudoalteromonas arctica]|uniref:glycosyltransferase family 4 protein n=1 Tax=Pseudoalteromonas arctica TaxID=394751 RepID=UPI002493DB97|nr:glycosyltransferase family 4 protein [Pseudoalteromonas arctica]
MKNKKTLLFWGELPPTVFHGISISNERILSALASEFDIYTVEDRGSFGGRLKALLSFFISTIKLGCLSLRKFDIYYINMPMSYLGLWKVYISVSCIKFLSSSTKVITHLHRGDFLDFIELSRNKKLLKYFLNRVDLVLTLSETSKSELVESELIKANKAQVLHNSILVLKDKAKILNNIPNEFQHSNFYCLCNYIPTKRIHRLVEIANEIPLTGIIFNGAAETKEYMQSLAVLDIGNICSFNGVVNGVEKERLLNEAKALVLPSLNEGMPLVILESLAQSTPVICYDIGYIRDYVGSEYPGLVKELTNKALKEKIEWLQALPPQEYLALRKKSFDLFWNNYEVNKVNSLALKIFQGLI